MPQSKYFFVFVLTTRVRTNTKKYLLFAPSHRAKYFLVERPQTLIQEFTPKYSRTFLYAVHLPEKIRATIYSSSSGELTSTLLKTMNKMSKNVKNVLDTMMKDDSVGGSHDEQGVQSDRIVTMTNSVRLVEELEKRYEKIQSLPGESADKMFKLRATKVALDRATKLMMKVAEESDDDM